MSEFRVNNFKSKAVYDEATTAKIELPNAGFLSYIALKIAEKTAASLTDSSKQHVIQHITKIELIGNGSEIIFSATGMEALALFANRHGYMAPAKLFEGLSKNSYQMVPLFFGRHVKDKEFGLDLGRWKTVDLKITNDCSTTDYTDAELKYSLDLIFYEGAQAPKGYFKFTELKYWTTVASATEIIELPKGRMIDSIIVIGDPARVGTGTGASDAAYNYVRNIKLVTQNGKKVLYDELVRHLMYANMIEKGPTFKTSGTFYQTTGYSEYTFIGYRLGTSLTPSGAAHTIIPYETFPQNDYVTIEITKDASDQYVRWQTEGLMPYNSVMLDFNEDGKMKDMLDTVKEDPVELKILSNTSSGTARVCISEFIPY